MNVCNLPLISVIMPVYNSEITVGRAIQSVLDQTYTNFEFLIINDGSVDKTEVVIKSYLFDNRIKYIVQKNSGPSKARNKGLEIASGEYVTFVDSDDYIKSDYLEKLCSGVIQYNSDICCCGYECLEKNNTYLQHDFLPKGVIAKDNFVQKILLGTGGTVCSKIFKMSIIKDSCIKFDEKYSMCEDQLFAISVWEKSLKFCSINYYGYIYDKSNDNSLVKSVNLDTWIEQCNLVHNIYNILLKSLDVTKVNYFINPKIKNVVQSLCFCCVTKDWRKIKKRLNEEKVRNLIYKIKIYSFKELIYFIPVKYKMYFTVHITYSLLKNHLDKKFGER